MRAWFFTILTQLVICAFALGVAAQDRPSELPGVVTGGSGNTSIGGVSAARKGDAAAGEGAIVEGLVHAVVQLLAPAPLRGRLIALNPMTIYSGMGLGSAFWGMAADAFGLRGALLTAAAALAANLLLALWVPYRS